MPISKVSTQAGGGELPAGHGHSQVQGEGVITQLGGKNHRARKCGLPSLGDGGRLVVWLVEHNDRFRAQAGALTSFQRACEATQALVSRQPLMVQHDDARNVHGRRRAHRNGVTMPEP